LLYPICSDWIASKLLAAIWFLKIAEAVSKSFLSFDACITGEANSLIELAKIISVSASSKIPEKRVNAFLSLGSSILGR